MRADFALDLSHDAVRLLAQTEYGDDVLGEVPLAEPGFLRRLAELRRAAGHDGALPVDVLIPPALILYRAVDPGRSIPEQLHGTTQYDVEGLVWALSEDGRKVALVARETLDEAAAFATSHDFSPVAFSARPQPSEFPGRPLFDPAARLPEGPQAEPDLDAPAFRSRRETSGETVEIVPAPASRLSLVAAAETPVVARLDPGAGAEEAEAFGRSLSSEPDVEPDRVAPAPEVPRSEAEALTVFGARQRTRAASRSRWAPALLGSSAAAAAVAWFALSGASNVPPAPFEPQRAAVELAAGVDEAAEADLALAPAEPAGDEVVATVPDTSAEAEGPPPPGLEPRIAASEARPVWRAPATDPTPTGAVPSPPDSAVPPSVVTLISPAARHDSAPEAVKPPPPAGTTFDMDARGLVRATPEGAATPDGIVVYAAAPPLSPPLRGGEALAFEPDAPAADDPREESVTAAVAGTVPAEVAPSAEAEATVAAAESVAESGETGDADPVVDTAAAATAETRVPRVRPAPRPDDAPALAALEAPQGGPAVRPRLRPQNTDSAVAAALAGQDFETRAREAREQAATAGARLAVAPPATPPTSAEPEERRQADAPRVPTRASVARNATIEDAVRLTRINLIGVYGSASNRRALIRLPTGRYVKVKVGDRVDGGKVSAIGAGRLDYVKGGRKFTLAMPPA